MNFKIKGKSDCGGMPLKIGDKVRVCAVPDLTGMSGEGLKESVPVFKYAVGKCFYIDSFDQYGFAEIDFGIPTGQFKGMHSIVIEPYLLKKSNNNGKNR